MTATPDRIRWLTARTANASRRALLIAGIGALVVVVALLTFVLVPRRADRQLASALAALPPVSDTVPLRGALDGAQRTAERATAQLAAARATAQSIAPSSPGDSLRDSLTGAAPIASTVAPPARAAADSIAALEQLLKRARQSPLVESYRALVASPALRGDARVRSTLDTIEALNREREASAALGGPDARYAALTARLTALGQRLERLAEAEVAIRRAPLQTADSTRATDSTGTASLLAVSLPPDTLLESAVTRANADVAHADSLLNAARARNAEVIAQQVALRATAQAPIPPLAMLLAAMVLGLVIGFAVVLLREVRNPTVGTADELAALTDARVLVHDADTLTTASVTTWASLHYALTPLDDVASRVVIIADRPLLAETVRKELAQLANELTLTAAVNARSLPDDAQVVLVVRRGVSDLRWFSETVRAVQTAAHRIRAVVLWVGQVPLE